MESKTILFTVDGDKISPRTEQKAGVQGQHNITEVRFNVEEALVSGALGDSPTSRIRMQFIDGAGGFYSTGFLDVMSEILPDESAQYYVTCPIPNNVTNAGGLAYVYLVVTEIVYEDEKALENQVYISSPGKLFYTHSGVGSPSEYAYKVGISNALVNAEAARKDAEIARDEAEAAKEAVETELNRYISHWQPNTKYKVGDVCYYDHIADEYTGYSAILKCKTNHTSCPYNDPLPDIGYWTVNPIQAKRSERDSWGNVIHETYATKDEVVDTLGTINEVLATLVEVE